ncbi:MAG TPA: sigma-70 family RNA polymerase sigma factor [Anaerolineaceae bacterium]|nr:sigma-70 family RNA polymerase sigma factor [Anaerolineaceae bacterium]
MPRGTRNPDEKRLLDRAVHGDKEAFGDLYEMYMEQVYRYIYYRVNDPVEAEDLTSTVFLRAWESLPQSVDDQFNFRAWVYRIAHNLIIDRHRMEKPSVSIDNMDSLHDGERLPDVTHEENETIRQIQAIIQRLDPEYQQVLTCRFIMGLSHAETAKILKQSEVYIRVLQYRALKKVKELLLQETGGDGRSHRAIISRLHR